MAKWLPLVFMNLWKVSDNVNFNETFHRLIFVYPLNSIIFFITDNVYNELLTVHTESQTHKTAAIIQQLKPSGIPSGKESQSYLDDCAQQQLRCGTIMNLFRRCSLRKSIYHLKHQHSVWTGAHHSYKIAYPENLKANAVSDIKC